VTRVKKYTQHFFTLVELLAAMAVFSILLAVSLRLFSGAQQIWLRSEQKTDTFASARTAMEFMAARLQTIEYNDDEPFEFVDVDDDDDDNDDVNGDGFKGDGFKNPVSGYERDSVWFFSNMALGDGGHWGHFIRFVLVDPTDTDKDDAGTLQIHKYTGNGTPGYFRDLMPGYSSRKRRSKIKSKDQAMTHLQKVWHAVETGTAASGVGDPSASSVDLINNVVSLKMTRHIANGTDLKEEDGCTEGAPFVIDIELRVLDSRDSFRNWQQATDSEKEQIFIEHGYTFRRAVLLGKKGE